MNWKRGLYRWMKFNAVGATGVVVQLVMLMALLRFAGMNYLLATAIAVEVSVLNNFVWHRRWTWSDRAALTIPEMLWRFHLTSGAMSLIGNLGMMWLFVSVCGLQALLANVVAIVICSFINFALSDRFVFIS